MVRAIFIALGQHPNLPAIMMQLTGRAGRARESIAMGT